MPIDVFVAIIRGSDPLRTSSVAAVASRLGCAWLRVDEAARMARIEGEDRLKGRATALGIAQLAGRYYHEGVSTIIDGTLPHDDVVQDMQLLLLRQNIATYCVDVNELVQTSSTTYAPVKRADELPQFLIAKMGNMAADSLPSSGSEKLLLFLRHGKVQLPETCFADDRHVHLCDNGRAASRIAADSIRLFNPERIVSSSLPRALETAAAAGSFCAVPVEVDHRLRERCFEALYGLTRLEIAERYSPDVVEQIAADPDGIQFPGQESLEACRRRVVEAVVDWLETICSRIVFVSHGGPHSWLCTHVLGLQLSRLRSFNLDEGHFSVFSFSPQGNFVRLVTMNSADCST